MTELDEAVAPAPPAAEPKPERRRWPLVAWIVTGAAIAVAAAVAGLGTTGALLAGGCVAAAGVAGVVLWRLPHLRKHFARPGGARRRSLRLGGGRKTGARGKLPKLGMPKLGRGKLPKPGKGKLPRLGTGKLGRAGRGKLGTAGKLLGRGKGGARRAAGRAAAAGRKLGRGARKAAGKLPGIKGRGKRSGAGKGGGGKGSGKRRGLIRRGLGRLRPARGRKAAGGKAGTGGGPKKTAGRRARAAAAVAGLLPVAGVLAAAKRLRAWHRKRRGIPGPAPQDEQTPAPAAEPVTPAEQIPDRQPGQPLAPGTAGPPPARRNRVSSHIDAVTESIDQGIGGFEPENVDALGDWLRALPHVYGALAGGLARVAERFGGDLPVHPSVVEHLHEMSASAAGQQEYAGEAHHLFRTSHEADLERLEDPRPGEEFMDKSRQ